jgi:hypothetical protein
MHPTANPVDNEGDESGFVNRSPGQQDLRGSTFQDVMRGKRRPFDFWQWEGYGSYLEFLAGYIVLLSVLQVILGRWMW